MDEFNEYEEFTYVDTWQHCVIPSITGVFGIIRDLLAYNVLFNIITQSAVIPNFLFHSISFTLGLCMLYTIMENDIWHLLVFILLAYLLILFNKNEWHRKWINMEYLLEASCIFYLLACEYLYCKDIIWMKSRGLFMVATMKIISLASDVQHGCNIPCFIEYLGYTCCPANSIVGPWIPYKQYIAVQYKPSPKNLSWAYQTAKATAVSLLFLTVSNCWSSYLITDDNYVWIVAYRKALSFRTSHYFICYLSEAAMQAAGYKDERHKQKSSWGYHVTNPFNIEIPSSLVSVVISWNVPMHTFLKKYVYRSFRPYGQFKAIGATYFMSSLLHGFNAEIAAVLLTIGLSSYTQMKFQEKLSSSLNACLEVRPCINCTHMYNRSNVVVKFAHLCFSFLTVVFLIYLGVLMDSVGDVNGDSIYTKWESLSFLCHFMLLFAYAFILVR